MSNKAGAKIKRVKGVSDVFPPALTRLNEIRASFSHVFASFGYSPVELPIIEPSDLYLRKSGEEIVSRMYDFNYRGRRLCLRPEMTASAMRAYVENLQGAPLPVRLSYAGPVFRYERPQRAIYRQFTQVGIELIGGEGVVADSEMIAVACTALNAIGLKDYRVVIGHVEILNSFLDSLQIDGHLRGFLLMNMEALRRKGVADVILRLKEIYPAFDLESRSGDPVAMPGQSGLADILRNMDESTARKAILELLDSLSIGRGAARNDTEVADRLLAKIKHQNQTPVLIKALEFMEQLSRLAGPVDDVIRRGQTLFASYGVTPVVLTGLAELAQAIASYGVPSDKISIDLGLSRGLQYYTGMIFEIYHGESTEERQLCGGGRYDDLIGTLGGKKDVPAIGFSFGLERVLFALEHERGFSASRSTSNDNTQVLVIPITSRDIPYAIELSRLARAGGWKTEIEVRGRSARAAVDYAAKRGIAFVLLPDMQTGSGGTVIVRDMQRREDHRTNVSELTAKMREIEASYG